MNANDTLDQGSASHDTDVPATTGYAYWFTTLIVGVLMCAALPIFVDPLYSCFDTGSGCANQLDALNARMFSTGGASTAGIYWTLATAAAIGATVMWSRWFRAVTGKEGPQLRPVVATWLGTLAAVVAGSVLLRGQMEAGMGEASLGIVVLGSGLLTMGILEASRSLKVLASFVVLWPMLTLAIGITSSHSDLLGPAQPSEFGPTMTVLVPGVALVITGLAAAMSDLRRR